jgi:electron transfer flavoprotein beta subunit
MVSTSSTGVEVLVCVKRVPDVGSEVLLSDDGQSVDARHVGFTTSAHDQAAVELAVQTATDGTARVLSVGAPEATEQLRTALGVGCTAATLVEADPTTLGPADVAGEIAAVVRDHEASGLVAAGVYDLVLLGNDAADSGDYQVPIRLADALGRPVVTGMQTIEVRDTGDGGRVAHCTGAGPLGTETYEVPLPAVISVMEGGVEPRYPTITGRMKAKKVEIETREPASPAIGSGRVRLTVPETMSSTSELLGEGPEAAVAVVDLFEKLGVAR